MNIGIDATCWTNRRGFGRFARSLVGALLSRDSAHRFTLVFDASGQGVPVETGARHVVVPTRGVLDQGLKSRRAVFDLFRMARAVARERFDVFFFPSVDSFYPVWGRTRCVAAIHDTIPESDAALTVLSWSGRLLRRLKLWYALRRLDLVVTGSARQRGEISRLLHFPRHRVALVPYGVGEAFAPPAHREAARRAVAREFGVDGRYALHVGGPGPHKNVPRLVEAFLAMTARAGYGDCRLLLVGPWEDALGRLDRQRIEVRHGGWPSTVRVLGYQSDEALCRLYQGADVAVVPSLEEGCGLPGLEAAACGTPVVATSASPLPELLGSAAIGVDPRDSAAMAEAMAEMLGPRGEVARSHAACLRGRFSWERSADAALAAFEQASHRRDS